MLLLTEENLESKAYYLLQNLCWRQHMLVTKFVTKYLRVTLSGLSKTLSQMNHNRNTSVYSRQSNLQSDVTKLR